MLNCTMPSPGNWLDKKALVANKEYEKQLYVFMQLALREYVGTYTLDELLDKKENVRNKNDWKKTKSDRNKNNKIIDNHENTYN